MIGLRASPGLFSTVFTSAHSAECAWSLRTRLSSQHLVGAALVTLPVGRAWASLAPTEAGAALHAERSVTLGARASLATWRRRLTPVALPALRRRQRAGRAIHMTIPARIAELGWSLRARAPPSRLLDAAPATFPVGRARAGLAAVSPTRVARVAELLAVRASALYTGS